MRVTGENRSTGDHNDPIRKNETDCFVRCCTGRHLVWMKNVTKYLSEWSTSGHKFKIGASRIRRGKVTFLLFIILYSTMTNKWTQLFHKLSHSSYTFRHYRVVLRELAVSPLPSPLPSMPNAIQFRVYRFISHRFMLLKSQILKSLKY